MSEILEKIGVAARDFVKQKNLMGEEIQVRPIYVYNPDSKKTPKNAFEWAKRGCGAAGPEVSQFDNLPLKVMITGLDIRSEGCRAYKVLQESTGYQFDLREDQLVEAFKYCTISPGGKISGEFVWAICGSQCKLVLVGGDLYKELSKQKKIERVFIKKDEYKIGLIYSKKDDRKGYQHMGEYLFLGKVKLKDAKKVSYAFIEVPSLKWAKEQYIRSKISAAHFVTDCYGRNSEIQENYPTICTRIRDVIKNWTNMSCEERCNYNWYEGLQITAMFYKTAHNYYDERAPITIISDPSFEVVNCDEIVSMEFVLRLRDNLWGEHSYENGYGKNPMLNNEYYIAKELLGYNHRGDYYVKLRELNKNMNKKFQASLEWK